MRTKKAFRTGLLLTFVCAIALPALASGPADKSKQDGDSVRVQPFDLPQSVWRESREVYSLVSKFFDAHLGSQ